MVKSGEVIWIQPKENPKSTGKPSARSGHTITCLAEKAYLFGGCGVDNGAAAVFNDMYVLHISDSFKWEKVEAMGDVPSPRWRHTATLLPDNNTIFLFGGLCKVRAAVAAEAAALACPFVAGRAAPPPPPPRLLWTPPRPQPVPTLPVPAGQALQRHACL